MSLLVERGRRWMAAWVGIAFAASAMTLGGCGSLEAASSGQIGCAEEDIAISNDEGGIGTRTWVASCHGKKFFCSAVAGSESAQVSCKEALRGERRRTFNEGEGEMVRRREAPQPSEPAVTGCQFDTQCKGDRVCDDGECIRPRTKTRASALPEEE
jgi:hypothetical protein